MNHASASSPPPPPKQDAAVKTPPGRSPPAVKKKKSGCLPRLLLLVIIGALVFVVFSYPQKVESLTGMKLPAFIHAFTLPSFNTAPVREKTLPVALPTVAVKAVPKAPTETLATLTVRIQQLQHAIDNVKQEKQAMSVRLVRAEQQIARLVAQLADLQAQQGDKQTRLQIIDLQLQMKGDPAAAAEQLNRLAAVTEDTVAARSMLDEAARLKSLPQRSVLLSLLDELSDRPAVVEAAVAEETDIMSRLKTLFNVRHTPTATGWSPAQEKLEKLSFLLLTGQEDRYWRLLVRMRADGGGSQQVNDILQRLHEYGAPGYRIMLPELR